MQTLDRATLRKHEEKILRGLVAFYDESGHKSDTYRDDETGGIYEHKLANQLDYKLVEGDRSPPEFVEACRALEAQGYVRRTRRKQDFPELGIWPTIAGLDRTDYLESSILMKAWFHLRQRWPEILISAVTTIVTLMVARLLGLFGLGD